MKILVLTCVPIIAINMWYKSYVKRNKILLCAEMSAHVQNKITMFSTISKLQYFASADLIADHAF